MAVRNIKEAKRPKRKLHVSKYLWILIVVLIIASGIGKYYINKEKTAEMQMQIKQTQEEIAVLNAESADIEAILDDEDHLEFFEKIAREDRGYHKLGEKVIYGSSYGE